MRDERVLRVFEKFAGENKRDDAVGGKQDGTT
jgi:hypothetical protein